MKSVKEADVSGKRVIVRVDFDVPIKDETILDGMRLDNSIPTLKYLLEKKANLFLISKMGRPQFRDPKLSLKSVLNEVSKKLETEVKFKENLDENIPGDVILLENLRFWPEEEKGDVEFSKKLSSFGDIYVNECFATSHRTDTSIVEIPKILPSYAGLNLIREVTELKKVLENPERPLVSIIGGAKIKTKLPLINSLAKVSDIVLVGGKLMFELDKQNLADNVVVALDNIDKKDVGPETVVEFKKILQFAGTIVWNGPMGIIEVDKYLEGTRLLAQFVAESRAYKIIGGGDTIIALDKFKLLDKMDYVSTGGGAMLDFLSGKKLPGLIALGYYD